MSLREQLNRLNLAVSSACLPLSAMTLAAIGFSIGHADVSAAGLSNPGALTPYLGSSTISSGTVLIKDKQITGRITVAGGDVTFENCSFNFEDYYHLKVDGGVVKVVNSEFDGMNTIGSADDLAIVGDNITVQGSEFRRLVNSIRPGNNSLIESNLIHLPNTAFPPAHTDGIEIYGGSNIVVRSNVIDIAGGAGATGCINIATDFASITDILVEDNDFTGGSYSFYARLQGAGQSISNIRVKNNRWHTPHVFGPYSIDPESSISAWSGNTLDGQPLHFQVIPEPSSVVLMCSYGLAFVWHRMRAIRASP